MVRAAGGTPFLPANPVASMRLEGVLVRTRFPIPYERTGRDGVAEPLGMQRRPEEPSGIQKAYSVKPFGAQTPRFAGGGGSARISSLVLRYFERETEAQIKF